MNEEEEGMELGFVVLLYLCAGLLAANGMLLLRKILDGL